MSKLPEQRREPAKIEIPRIVLRGPAAGAGTEKGSARDAAEAVKFYANNNRQLRYQHLPDYDPNESDQQIEDKLTERFVILDQMAIESAQGRCRGLIVSGPGGVGKTYTIDERLKEVYPDGEGFTSYSGYSTPIGLLKMLWANRHPGSLVKADDIDSIFKDEKALNYIKKACDTTEKRIITYASENVLYDEDLQPIPKQFEFEGGMIFCTNLDFDVLIDKGSSLTPHFEALMTRSHYVDLGMRTKRDYLIRVFMVADQGLFKNVQGGELTKDEENEVLAFIEEYHRNLRECSLRMALKIGALRKAYQETDPVDWKRMALVTCCRGVR